MKDRKLIAWDGVSFNIPANWELAVYKFLKKGVTRVEIEDEYAVRMEAEWVRPKKKLQMDNILARYERKSKRMTIAADRKKPIKNLPEGWVATHYTFAETVPHRKKRRGLQIVKHGLVTAFFLCPDSRIFCFVMLHFLPEDKEDPSEIMRLVAANFRHHFDSGLARWQLFDIDFELPPDFFLENTLFDIGSKLMVFRWKMRRFYLWHFSCADMFIKGDTDVPKWVAAMINDFRRIRGGSFFVDDNGEIRWRRKRRHVIAHREEIARWCFSYKVVWHLDREKNQLVAWVFNYRRPADLRVIPEALRFGRMF